MGFWKRQRVQQRAAIARTSTAVYSTDDTQHNQSQGSPERPSYRRPKTVAERGGSVSASWRTDVPQHKTVKRAGGKRGIVRHPAGVVRSLPRITGYTPTGNDTMDRLNASIAADLLALMR